MGSVRFLFDGPDAGRAAEVFRERAGVDVEIRERTEAGPEGRKLDPDTLMAAVALVVSIPSAFLAVLQLKDRLAKRPKAEKLLAVAMEIRNAQNVNIYLVSGDSMKKLDKVTPDDLLETANKKDSSG